MSHSQLFIFSALSRPARGRYVNLAPAFVDKSSSRTSPAPESCTYGGGGALAVAGAVAVAVAVPVAVRVPAAASLMRGDVVGPPSPIEVIGEGRFIIGEATRGDISVSGGMGTAAAAGPNSSAAAWPWGVACVVCGGGGGLCSWLWAWRGAANGSKCKSIKSLPKSIRSFSAAADAYGGAWIERGGVASAYASGSGSDSDSDSD